MVNSWTHLILCLALLGVHRGSCLRCYKKTSECKGTSFPVSSREECCKIGGVSYGISESFCGLVYCSNEPVDCLWAYTPFSECRAAGCDDRRIRFPYILQQPMHRGHPCPTFVQNGTVDERPCNATSHAIDCRWTYSQYSSCSASCGVGVRARVPIILEHPQFGGKPCLHNIVGRQPDILPCYEEPCDGDCPEWGEWSHCSVTCGLGERTRSRKYIPQTSGCLPMESEPCGGGYCPFSVGDDCPEWNEWSPCSVTCGLGERIRSRESKTPECQELFQTVPCGGIPCPIDCVWERGPPTECSATCGGGVRYFPIIIVQHPYNGGRPCPLPIKEQCNTEPCPVDCVWERGPPTECSATCGGGFRSFSIIIMQHPYNGGLPCPPPFFFTEECNYEPCPDAHIRLEREMYEVFESAGSLEICAVADSSSAQHCPANYTLVVHLFDDAIYSEEDYAINNSMIIFKPCSTRACTDVVITDDNLAEVQESFDLYLEDFSNSPDGVNVSTNISIVTIIDNDAMIIGFESLVFTAIESEGVVQVCASLLNSPDGALEPFTVAFIPEEDYQVSNDQFVLECKRRDTFPAGSQRLCINYTINDDKDCELQHNNDSYFEVRLTVLSTSDRGPLLDFNRSVAAVTIDDSLDEECYVSVGYEQSKYILNEEGYVELCIGAMSPGISVEFIISLDINNTELNQSVEAILFSVNDRERNITQCYNVSMRNNITCDSFSECQNLTTLAYFQRLNGSNQVTLQLTEVEIKILIPGDCLKNCSTGAVFQDNPMVLGFPEIPSGQPASTPANDPVVQVANNNTVVIALATSVPAILLVIVAIFTLTLIYILTRRRRKTNVFIATGGGRFLLSERNTSALSEELKQQLNDKKMIVSKDLVKLTSTIGQGQSGLVYRAYLTTVEGNELVAVKTGKALFSNTDMARLAKEISTMLSFDHPNVMSLIGVCLDVEVPLLIMPYMSNGSLLSYVTLHKEELLRKTKHAEGQKPGQILLAMCFQVAKGMEYLAQQRFVHRDLAARNCMISKSGMIKVADFGLTEDMYSTNYFRRQRDGTNSEEKVPIRWMAPESIENDIYTEATDVWSYGVTVWEVFTCGRIPYTGIPAMSLLKSLQRGERLERPDNETCTDEIYEMMKECWDYEQQKRPNFQKLVERISNLLERESGYLDLTLPGNEYDVPITPHQSGPSKLDA